MKRSRANKQSFHLMEVFKWDSKKIFMYRKRTELNNVLQSLLSYKYMLNDINKKFIFNISSIGKI